MQISVRSAYGRCSVNLPPEPTLSDLKKALAKVRCRQGHIDGTSQTRLWML